MMAAFSMDEDGKRWSRKRKMSKKHPTSTSDDNGENQITNHEYRHLEPNHKAYAMLRTLVKRYPKEMALSVKAVDAGKPITVIPCEKEPLQRGILLLCRLIGCDVFEYTEKNQTMFRCLANEETLLMSKALTMIQNNEQKKYKNEIPETANALPIANMHSAHCSDDTHDIAGSTTSNNRSMLKNPVEVPNTQQQQQSEQLNTTKHTSLKPEREEWMLKMPTEHTLSFEDALRPRGFRQTTAATQDAGWTAVPGEKCKVMAVDLKKQEIARREKELAKAAAAHVVLGSNTAPSLWKQHEAALATEKACSWNVSSEYQNQRSSGIAGIIGSFDYDKVMRSTISSDQKQQDSIKSAKQLANTSALANRFTL